MDQVSALPAAFLCVRLKCQILPSYEIFASPETGGCAASSLLRDMLSIQVPEKGGIPVLCAEAKEPPSKSPSASRTTVFMEKILARFGRTLKPALRMRAHCLNGSTQHSSRTRLALKTKAKSLARVRSAGTLPWLGFARAQPNGSVPQGKYCRVNRFRWCCIDRLSSRR